jgi:hypothetical protein
MAGFQHTSILDFFDKSNASLVKTLADKYGFDAADAMLHIKGIDTSLVLTKTKTKKTKDLNVPKRSPTAFFLFSKQYREEHASDIAGMKASDVQKLAGAACPKSRTPTLLSRSTPMRLSSRWHLQPPASGMSPSGNPPRNLLLGRIFRCWLHRLLRQPQTSRPPRSSRTPR